MKCKVNQSPFVHAVRNKADEV